MLSRLKSFALNDNGAVTVDWVVLCAAVIMLMTALTTAMYDATGILTGKLTDHMASAAPTQD